MHLFFLLIISVFTTQIFRISALDLFSDMAEITHHFCLQHLPKKSSAISELRALVCAENFTHLTQSELYISSGLIHLFVVSGSHLLLLEKALQADLLKKYLRSGPLLLLITAYAMACGLSAPVTRALLTFYLGLFLYARNIRWPFYHKTLFIGLSCLVIQPEWLSSISLQLSWLAAFTVGFTEKFADQFSALTRQSLFFFLLFPTLVFMQVPSPITIIMNLLLAPLLEFVLFPLGLLIWFIPFLHPVFDLLITALRFILQRSELDYSYQLSPWPENLLFFNWGLIFTLQLLSQLLHTHWSRKKSLCL